MSSATMTAGIGEWVKFTKAMRRLDCSRSHLLRLIASGKIRATRLTSRVLLLRVEDVQALLAAGEVRPEAPAQQTA